MQVAIRVRDVKLEKIFVVSQINEDVILGMPYLASHDCRMDFTQPIELVTDRFGRLMTSQKDYHSSIDRICTLLSSDIT